MGDIFVTKESYATTTIAPNFEHEVAVPEWKARAGERFS